jgi:two-component system OmpR family sensor kinase
LSLKDVPAELYPFVESINRLHGRVRRTLEQQNRFVADAAHELRSPVQALNIQVENLNQTNLPAESANRLLILRSGIKRIARLLEQLLTMAKYDAPKDKFPILSLDSVAKGVVADVIEAAQDRSIDLGFSRFEESPVRGDEISLAIIIRNLLENAIRHTPDLGRIDLAVYSEGEFSFFVVQDSGAGIPFDEIERVFSPFYRGNAPSGEGAGLGLSIVQRVVSALGGHVTLQNAAGGGLRAVIKLPKAIKSSEPKI